KMPRVARHYRLRTEHQPQGVDPGLALPWVMKPKCTMPADFASCMTFQITRYGVVLSARMFNSGCGLPAAAERNLALNTASLTRLSFQYTVPSGGRSAGLRSLPAWCWDRHAADPPSLCATSGAP